MLIPQELQLSPYSIAGLNMKNMAKSMAYCHIFVQMINRYNVQTI